MLRYFLKVSLAVGVLGVTGCTSTPAQQNPPKPYETTIIKGAGPNVSGAGVNSKDYFDVDSCANRLHSIEGQIIYYYARFHRLPNSLEELRPFADPGESVDYSCPVSHQSYVYVQNGLALGADPKRLIVFDATPVHNGYRWGILLSFPSGRQPLKTDVIPIKEDVMKGYVPAPPIAAPMPTSRPMQPLPQ